MALRRTKVADRPAAGATPVAARNGNGHGVPAGAGRDIGELLVQKGLVSDAQLEEAVAKQPESGHTIAEILVATGAVAERDVVALLGERIGVPFCDLRRDSPDPDVVALLPEATAKELIAIPLRREDDAIVVVAAEPVGEVVDKLKKAMKVTIKLMIAPAADIERAINNAYRAIDSVGRLVDAFAVAEASRKTSAVAVEVLPDDAPVVRVVNLLISQAVRDRASDIHIEPMDDKVRVRYRIDGALTEAVSLPEDMGPAVISRVKIMAALNIVERRKPQDGQISAEIEGRMLDIRVSTMPTIWGEKCVMRILDRKRTMRNLNDLGMPPEVHENYAKIVKSPWGMVVVAGPTGSGKTTTLYATLNDVNDPKMNITTLEDPVEFVFPTINQIQLNEQAGTTFATGLRAILRQDPDIILVGEIRDLETARLAVQAALTGHFVLSTIHATDSPSALHRFVDMGVERFLIASSVTLIVSQRLLRRICQHCRQPYEPSVEEQAFFAQHSHDKRKTKFWHGEGCNFCAGTGYSDRIGIYELLKMTDEIRQLVLENAVHEEIKKMAISQGMSTLLDEGMKLVHRDVTTVAEVMRHVYTV